ncbi:MFS transporter [Nocardia sp. NBC_00565]|uniref:MFS transporter n=1 Tax=Nocardia sp. NBC_00565 TaxID=2975993 RepID=UPI002E80E5FA|nr:MFS transporter [Nocardia sp. NBC_00565]WUC02720.1 MFS transporter [Nocardia sp. NBC_00565]
MDRSGIHTNRNFLLLWSGNATSLVGFHGVRIAYPLLALTVTGSPAAAGWVGFALSVPSLIFQIPAGVVADCSDRLRTLLLCQVIGLTATCLAAVAVAAQLSGLGQLLGAAAFVEGSVYVFLGLSELAAVRDLVTLAQRPAAFSFLEAEQPIAILVGRAAGAAIYGVARWLPFAANAVSYLYCFATLVLIRSNSSRSYADESADRSVGRNIAAGVRVVWTEPFLRVSTAMIGGSNIVIQVVLLLILVELKRGGHPAWTVGVVLGTAGVGGVLGAAAASWVTRRIPPRLVYRGALWAWTALLVPIALSANTIVLAVCWGAIGGVGVVSNVALTLCRVEVIPEHTLGRTVAAMAIVCDGAVAIGALGAGYLLSTVGIVTTRWTALAAMCTLAVYATIRTAARTTAQR